MRTRVLITFGLTALVASAVAFAACGGDDNKGASGPPAVDAEATTTSSGLQIIDITEGGGAEAEVGKHIIVHYTGWLEADGTKFDSSRDRDQPFPIVLGATPPEVIAGWEEGLIGMKVGGQRRLIIPGDLAYGAGGFTDSAGNVVIPPNATLIFDIELLDVQDVPSPSPY